MLLSPTNIVWIIARFGVDNVSDIANVGKLQAQMSITLADPSESTLASSVAARATLAIP